MAFGLGYRLAIQVSGPQSNERHRGPSVERHHLDLSLHIAVTMML